MYRNDALCCTNPACNRAYNWLLILRIGILYVCRIYEYVYAITYIVSYMASRSILSDGYTYTDKWIHSGSPVLIKTLVEC